MMSWALMQSTIPWGPSNCEGDTKKRAGVKMMMYGIGSLQTPPLMAMRRSSSLNNNNSRRKSSVSVYGSRKNIVAKVDFTCEAKQVIKHANEEARRIGHKFVGTEIILLGLIGEGSNIAAKVFKSMGIGLSDARSTVVAIIGKNATDTDTDTDIDTLPKEKGEEIPFTPRVETVFQLSLEEAKRTGHKYIGPEHLLLGLLGKGGCVVSRVLKNLGAYPNNIRKQVMRMVEERAEEVGNRRRKMPILEEYGTDFTSLVYLEQKLHEVVGRELEIQKVNCILGKLTKNNPCLVGENGVGKTSIATGCVQDILSEVVALDMRLLGRGEFEERLKKIMEEIKQNREIVLFIDEVHTLFGTGVTHIATANILKQALVKGELQCIGATTPDEYRKHLDKDPTFERLFQPVMVLEPTVNETVEILKGLQERFENHHNVRYTDEALVAAAQLSYQFINDRFLPSKAIDLMDEAGSNVRQLCDEGCLYCDSELLKELDCLEDITPKELLEPMVFYMKNMRSMMMRDADLDDQDLDNVGRLRDDEFEDKVELWSLEERIQEMKKAKEDKVERIQEMKKAKEKRRVTVTKADIQETLWSWHFQL